MLFPQHSRVATGILSYLQGGARDLWAQLHILQIASKGLPLNDWSEIQISPD